MSDTFSLEGKEAADVTVTPPAGRTGTDLQALATEFDTAIDTAVAAALALSSTTPSALGVAAVGNGTTAARSNHVHAMPSAVEVGALSLSAGGNLAANVTASGGVTIDGRDLSVDGAKLDGIATAAAALTNSAPSALGVQAVGDATTAARANHVHLMPSAADVSADPAGTTATHAALTNPHSATAANTADRIVLRDGSGNFAAGTITAALTGTASGNLTASSWASPGTIGSVSPNSGAFTTATATGQITSTLANGTAPLVVASSTKVTNLNADLLDDLSSAAFQPVSATLTTLASSTAAGLALMDDADAPAQLVTLGAAASADLTSHTGNTTYPHNVRTTYDFSSSTGWTTTSGSGTASITSGKARLVIPLSTVAYYDGVNGYNGPQIFRSHGCNQMDFSVYARLSVYTNPDTFSNTGIVVLNSDGSNRYAILVISDGTVYAVNLTTNTNLANTAAAALPLDGTGWMLLRLSPSAVSFWYGTGTTSVPPTTWTMAYTLPLVAISKSFDRCGVFSRQVIAGNPAQTTADFDDLRTIDHGGLWQY